MASIGIRRGRAAINAWPGWVDALATIVMVVMFLLMVAVVAQFYLREALSGRDQALRRLAGQMSELAELLSLEKKTNEALRANLTQLSTELKASIGERDDLSGRLERLTVRLEAAEMQAAQNAVKLADANKIVAADREKIELQLKEIAALQGLREELRKRLADDAAKLKAAEDEGKRLTASLGDANKTIDQVARQLAALREQLQRLNAALDASEAKNKDQETQIADLGKRLNVALASKVQELARYRSEFFGRLREVLGERPDIRVVGDRFVFQSEVLFASASADLGEEGRQQLAHLAAALKEVSAKIPAEVNWVLRIDGHTDRRPISTSQFPSNWELSFARSLSVVKYLAAAGMPADRLAAAGFGEFQPIDARDDEIAYRRNRRIEIKFDQR